MRSESRARAYRSRARMIMQVYRAMVIYADKLYMTVVPVLLYLAAISTPIASS